MRFTYTYRSSDGQRHSAEIEAENRDAAFEAIRRERGVKPIKVTAAEGAGGTRNGTPNPKDMALLVAAGLALLAAGLGGAWWWAARRSDAPYRVMTPQGPVTYTVATPLPRQTIPGDRARIDAARETAFRSPAEAWLARFAEPGRLVSTPQGEKPTETEFSACLREPIRTASTDFTEVVDLKRIVSGMKREMRAYITGGGTVGQYLIELEKRQHLEVSYRENAERRLDTLLAKPKEAYAYWLKANAQLQAMGIYPLTLPDALRTYQMSLDIEE